MASSAVRSMLRVASSRSAAASSGRFASQAKSAPPLFRATARRSSLLSPLRNPVEMSFCVESLLPYHTATASALMNSKLSISGHTYGWLSDGQKPVKKMDMDETSKTDCVTIVSQIKDEEKQLRFKRRWLLGLEPHNLTPGPGDTEFIPESLLREDDVFYETIKSHVEEAFGFYKNEQVCNVEESELCTKDVVTKLDGSLDSLTNKALFLIATSLSGGSTLFYKTRGKMKKLIRESIKRQKPYEGEIVIQMHQLLCDPANFRNDGSNTPCFHSQRDAALKVLTELEKLSTQTLLAMKRKLAGLTTIPRLKITKTGLSRDILINQVRQTSQEMLSQEKGDKLQERLAKAMSLADLSYRLSHGDKTTVASNFFHFSPETKKLQNEIVKAFWSLGRVRFDELKCTHVLLDPEGKVSSKSFRAAVRSMLTEYLFECSDMNNIPKHVLEALSLVNNSRQNVDFKVFPREAIMEETECILNVSAQVKQILWQCIPDHELHQDFDDAYMEELEDSDDDENCTFFDNEVEDSRDDAFEEGGAECDPTASADATDQHCFSSSVVIRDLTRSITTPPPRSVSVTPTSNNHGEQKNKNQYLALQEIADDTSLLSYKLIGALLEKFADQAHLSLEDNERSYLGAKSMSQEDIKEKQAKFQDKSDESIMVSVIKELVPSLKKSVLMSIKDILK